jgi:hypothetical protein
LIVSCIKISSFEGGKDWSYPLGLLLVSRDLPKDTFALRLVCGDFSGLYSDINVRLFAEAPEESLVPFLSEAELKLTTGFNMLMLFAGVCPFKVFVS